MRLSEVKGPQAIEVIADLVEPVAEIAQSDGFKGMFEKRELPEGMEPTEFFLSRVKASLPKLLKENEPQLVAILAAVNGKEPKEYEADMTPYSVLADAMALITDKAFVDFLSSLSAAL